MRWLKEYWPEAVPVLVLLAWKTQGLSHDLLLTISSLLIGLTVLVVGLRYVKGYQRPLTTALWLIALVVLVTGSIPAILSDLQFRPRGLWPRAYVSLTFGLATWAIVVWLSGRLARHGLSFAFLLCAAYLAYSFTNPGIPSASGDRPTLLEAALRVAAGFNAVSLAATAGVLIRLFPALDRDAQRRGFLLLGIFPLVSALIGWFAMVYPSYDGTWMDRFAIAVSFTVPYIVIALVLLGATRLVARRYLPVKL